MKNKIHNLIKKLGLSILSYKTYRSDMGCQVYEVYVTNGVQNKLYNDSYFVGQKGGKDYILESMMRDFSPLTPIKN